MDGRLSAGSEAMGRAPCCGDLGPCGGAAQVSNDGAAYADRVLLDQGSSEDAAPLMGRPRWAAARSTSTRRSLRDAKSKDGLTLPLYWLRTVTLGLRGRAARGPA
jgi:hypothetical protein